MPRDTHEGCPATTHLHRVCVSTHRRGGTNSGQAEGVFRIARRDRPPLHRLFAAAEHQLADAEKGAADEIYPDGYWPANRADIKGQAPGVA